jgi:HAD superfamily hydrolase (TIGR01509 family)
VTGFAAVIFDMDGVLVDGEPLHFEAVNQLMAEEGRSITLEQYKPYMGTKSGWSEMIRDFGLMRERAYYTARYLPLVLERYRAKSVPLPGALELVAALRRVRIPLAVASSSILPWVEACLAKLGLLESFDAIVTGSDVVEGKPDPAIYLLAAQRLRVDPSRCLAFEDAPAGILSAKAAGITCWAVRTEYTTGLELPSPQREFQSLTEVDIADIVGVPV